MRNEAWAQHPDEDALAHYALGTASDGFRSVERHLDRCSRCRDWLSHQESVALVVDSVWAELSDAVDAVVSSPGERWLMRLGVPDHVARLVASVPALRVSWLGASALLMLLAALTSRLLAPDGAPAVFVLLAPLLPVVSVALCFDARWEPAGEMALVAPLSMFRVALLRTAVVLGTCVVTSTAAALTLPDFGLEALAWLAPSGALTALSLLLSRHMNPANVCAVAGGAWIVPAAVTQSGSWLTSAQGQLVLTVVCAGLLFGLVMARSTFDTERKALPS